MVPATSTGGICKLQGIGRGAVQRRFSPEFINRIDSIITYQPLDEAAIDTILDQQITALERHINNRLEEDAFDLEVTREARKVLLKRGVSKEYGARELRRTILRLVTQPLAALVEQGFVPPGCAVIVDRKPSTEELELIVEE
jgi:ATP-dependent Clp protease ATP-binding subunit ClpA